MLYSDNFIEAKDRFESASRAFERECDAEILRLARELMKKDSRITRIFIEYKQYCYSELGIEATTDDLYEIYRLEEYELLSKLIDDWSEILIIEFNLEREEHESK